MRGLRSRNVDSSPGFLGRLKALFEDLVVAAIKLVIGEMRVSLGYRDAAVPRKLLSQLEVATRTSQNSGDEVVAEGMRRNDSGLRAPQRFCSSPVHDGTTRRGRNRQHPFAGAFVMSGKERQRSQGSAGGAVQGIASIQVGLQVA